MDVINNNPNIPDYFRSSTNKEADKEESRLIQQKIHGEISDVLTRFGCLKSTFKLQMREGCHPYQISPQSVAYTFQE